MGVQQESTFLGTGSARASKKASWNLKLELEIEMVSIFVIATEARRTRRKNFSRIFVHLNDNPSLEQGSAARTRSVVVAGNP